MEVLVLEPVVQFLATRLLAQQRLLLGQPLPGRSNRPRRCNSRSSRTEQRLQEGMVTLLLRLGQQLHSSVEIFLNMPRLQYIAIELHRHFCAT